MLNWLNNKTPTVEFFLHPDHIGIFPDVAPANKLLPSYFRRLKPQSDSAPQSGTVKRCVPFLDAMSLGFIIPLWADLHVVARGGELSINFPENLNMQSSLSPHGFSQIENHPWSGRMFGDIPLKFHNPWGIKTPKGHSVLITSPLNHLDPNFKLLDGVVDTDEYYNQINFPFVWVGGEGEFFIPRGTPLAHVIPFKREVYNSKIVEQDCAKQRRVSALLGTKMKHAYRSFFWNKRKAD